jgi:hypothetical protein
VLFNDAANCKNYRILVIDGSITENGALWNDNDTIKPKYSEKNLS